MSWHGLRAHTNDEHSLYFSASWCPPCVQFSPELNDFAGEFAKDFVLVLVSSDRDEAAFLRYSGAKEHFLRIPFGQQDKIAELGQRFQIYALPTLQILSAEGDDLTSWGRAAVTRNRAHCVQQWKQGSSGASLLSLLGLW